MAKSEEYFGVNAGRVWHALNDGKHSTLQQLMRRTRLKESEVYGALGWLAREGKVEVSGSAPLLKFRLL